uniref:Uncharacterized protein n=1 Tax=Glossina pallidipes TaxID=7398 RepID=A0A1B0A6B8_GLOPL
MTADDIFNLNRLAKLGRRKQLNRSDFSMEITLNYQIKGVQALSCSDSIIPLESYSGIRGVAAAVDTAFTFYKRFPKETERNQWAIPGPFLYSECLRLIKEIKVPFNEFIHDIPKEQCKH